MGNFNSIKPFSICGFCLKRIENVSSEKNNLFLINPKSKLVSYILVILPIYKFGFTGNTFAIFKLAINSKLSVNLKLLLFE